MPLTRTVATQDGLREFDLDNGLKVLVRELHTAPLVSELTVG